MNQNNMPFRILTKNFASIGTRDLTDSGLQSIINACIVTIDYAFVRARE